MTDKVLVNKYLDSQYFIKFSLASRDYIVIEKDSKKKYSIGIFYPNLESVFNGIKDLKRIFDEWFFSNLFEANNEFYLYLKDCDVFLDSTDWVVRHKDFGDVATKNMITLFTKDNLDIYGYYLKWFDKKINDIFEKQLQNL